jgi:hypothetical protein
MGQSPACPWPVTGCAGVIVMMDAGWRDGLCLAAGPRGCKQLLQEGSAPRRSTACSISYPGCAVRGPMRRRRTASASSPSSAHGSAASRPQPAECSTQHASHPPSHRPSLHKHRRRAPLGRSRKGHAAVPLQPADPGGNGSAGGPHQSSARQPTLRSLTLPPSCCTGQGGGGGDESYRRVALSSCSRCCPLACSAACDCL